MCDLCRAYSPSIYGFTRYRVTRRITRLFRNVQNMDEERKNLIDKTPSHRIISARTKLGKTQIDPQTLLRLPVY